MHKDGVGSIHVPTWKQMRSLGSQFEEVCETHIILDLLCVWKCGFQQRLMTPFRRDRQVNAKELDVHGSRFQFGTFGRQIVK